MRRSLIKVTLEVKSNANTSYVIELKSITKYQVTCFSDSFSKQGCLVSPLVANFVVANSLDIDQARQ